MAMAKLHLFCVCFPILVLLNFSRIAVSQTLVRYLPGFAGPLPFELETGYVSVDESNDVELFYYFVKSENNPMEDPLVLWMTGGPGCSSLSAFTIEIGPLVLRHAKYTGQVPTMRLNPYSWTKAANIIFLDTPVGTGFSYSRSLPGFHSSDTLSAKQATTFLTKWLIDHPEYIRNPLYIGGDSYSGKNVPIIVQDISDRADEEEPQINLKGYILGNPITNRDLEVNYYVPYLHGMGMISDELYESTWKNCGGDFANVDPDNVKCNIDVDTFWDWISGINQPHILEPNCELERPKPKNFIRGRSSLENKLINISSWSIVDPGFECRSYSYMLLYYWANDYNVQKALNIKKGTIDQWVRCNYGGLHYLENVKSSVGYHSSVSKKGRYRSLIYSGDHDLVVPFLSTQEWVRSLGYPIRDEWRPWLEEKQVAGFTRTYTNDMTFATVKGGGHTAPEYKPKECLAMFKRWLANEPL
ncbi:sinapoylglucose--choline O-sinapoyltransferase [Ranunculus cassubicifolius]